MVQPSDDEFRHAIRDLHGCDSHRQRVAHVMQTSEGRAVWEGPVQVYDLRDHPAGTCYAWSYELEGGERRFVAVLHGGGVDSPQAAVRAFIVSEGR